MKTKKNGLRGRSKMPLKPLSIELQKIVDERMRELKIKT